MSTAVLTPTRSTNDVATSEQVSLWQIDPSHSRVSFSVRHMMISNVRGEFQKFSGSLKLNKTDISKSSAEAAIDALSIQTHDANRDQHLRSADFFDAEKYPEISFISKQFRSLGEGELKVVGDLTIHGVTKEVTLSVDGPTDELQDPWGGARIGVTATTKIKRKDFGLSWNVALEAGGFVVGDDITITIEAELVKVNNSN
jgi:polyisoprenoid-binding protein YceI